MKLDNLPISIFIVGMCFVVPLAAVLITMRLAKDVAHAICQKLGLVHQAQEPVPVIDVYPIGDIPQPETSNIGDKLSVLR